ncbi:hypothetical protein RJT34_03336 [Clitoria ternatea]|uniref:Transmembrane protein n=1 Tax=Clitoria ternatea TaxID=43366 RepID=A0AAN9Q4Z6_CLITE
MLLTCHHHPFPLSHSFSPIRNHNLSITTLRPLHLTTPIPNLKPFTPHTFPFLTPHADPSPLRSHHVAAESVFDSLLTLLEFSSLLSALLVSAAVALVAASRRELLPAILTRAAPWGVALLVVGVLVGAWIRRRQWRRVCRETVRGDGLEVNLLERIEKLEEDLKSSATVARVLSRQLEKLGVRFRVTRKSLKEPLTETAALAQKNSEAARALAVQSDILEKELGEIQQVLLAMQEQQRKQLDLILAIGKAGKLWESKQETSEENNTLEISNSAVDEVKQESTSYLLWIQFADTSLSSSQWRTSGHSHSHNPSHPLHAMSILSMTALTVRNPQTSKRKLNQE